MEPLTTKSGAYQKSNSKNDFPELGDTCIRNIYVASVTNSTLHT